MPYILPLADPRATLEVVGGKGASLARLTAAGLPVPGGFHLTTAAYRQFVAEGDLQPRIVAALAGADPAQPSTLEAASRAISALFLQAAMPPAIAEAITQAYLALNPKSEIQNYPSVAVRSSATAEDLADLSFAGQQETYLNICGPEAVLEAVKKCWASLWTARAIGYRLLHHVDQDGLSLAVVVQTLVFADAAGVLFTANPVNGQRGQAMLTATWGLGEAIVGGLVTPDTLTLDKATGHVLSRETADKQVMTVRVAGGTQEQPVPEDRRRAPVLDDRQAGELLRLGVQIEQQYGTPMDIEWTWADGQFAIVQARPITALPEPEAPAPTEWKLPKPKGQYMRASIVDLMPDPLSPLFASWGIPAARSGALQAIRDLMRTEPVIPSDYFTTINSYAYMGVKYSPRELWWMVSRMMPAMLRMVREGLSYWRETAQPRYAAVVARWQSQAPEAMPARDLWRAASELIEAAMDYLGALMLSTMGASSGAEMLFTQVYDRLAKKAGDPPATTFIMGYDSTPIRAEKSLYDLAQWCRERPALAAYLLSASGQQVAALLSNAAQSPNAEPPAGLEAETWRGFGEQLQNHLQRYGHIIYTLDVAQPLPLDHPAPMIETVKMYLRGEGANPHARQRAAEEKRIQSGQAMFARLKGLRRWAFKNALAWAQSLAEVRETALATIGLGYPTLRQILRELGRRLVEAGAIAEPDDIFCLERAEVEQAAAALESGSGLPGATPLASLAATVTARRAAWQAARRVSPPPMLPPSRKFMGFDVSSFVPETGEGQPGDRLKGVPASAGTVTAPARVLHGPEDFDQMRPGEVLVAAITTPAWTPLFAMASAVVTDVGGPLSHGSIVAREYGLPAVMGTGVATKRIHSGQVITVDGNTGVVSLATDEG